MNMNKEIDGLQEEIDGLQAVIWGLVDAAEMAMAYLEDNGCPEEDGEVYDALKAAMEAALACIPGNAAALARATLSCSLREPPKEG